MSNENIDGFEPKVLTEIDDGFDVDHDPQEIDDEATVEEAKEQVEEAPPEITPETFLTGPAPFHPNVTLAYSVYTEIDTDKKVIGPLRIIPKRMSRTKDFTHWGLTKEDNKDEVLSLFVNSYLNAIQRFNFNGTYHEKAQMFENTLDSENSEWVQEFIHEDKILGVRKAKITEKYNEPIRLRGKKVRQRISALLGTGSEVRTSLFATGLDALFRPRDELEFLVLDQKINRDKVRSGYGTTGLIFQNSQYGLTEHLFDFAMDSLESINLKEYEDDEIDLSTVIRITDLPSIYHAMALANNPNGYPLELPCSSGPSVCTHVESVNLDISRILWINKTAFSKAQRSHMSQFRKMYSLADLETYRSSSNSKLVDDFQVKFNDRVTVTFHVEIPTVATYLEAGRAWVKATEEALIEIISAKDMTAQEKGQLVDAGKRLQVLREYSAWISKIVINRNENIEGRQDIEDALSDLSRNIGNNKPLEEAFSKIQSFIEETATTVVAIPNYSCKVCGRDHQDPETLRHPELIPIDPSKTFLELKDRQLLRLGQRLNA